MKRWFFLLLFSPLVHAELSAEAVLKQVYPQYDKKHQCRIANDTEGLRYCMKLDHSAKINTATGERLYVLAAGDFQDEQGENSAGHANSGLIGAFVAEEKDGKLEIIHGNAKINIGSFGIAPTAWQFVKLGADDYWGWHNTAGWTGQGYTFSYYAVLAPYGKSIRNLMPSGFIQSYDDTGVCSVEDQGCEPRTEIESELSFDTSDNAKIFPMRLTVTGKDVGKDIGKKVWTIPFDTKTWTYPQPTDWILKDKNS